MTSFFLDTSYHVAMIDRRDQLHAATLALARQLERTRDATFVTTDDVLVELLTFMSKQSPSVRTGTVLYVDGLDSGASPRS